MTLHNFSPRKKGNILENGQWIGVDAMMLLYLMKTIPAIWSAQTQRPPVPQWETENWLDSWLEVHEFQKREQVLVFVLDGRIVAAKTSRSEERRRQKLVAEAGMRAARTLKEYEKHQAATAVVNGDLVFQFVAWVRDRRKQGVKIMVLGAPFEADAQLVQIQKQGLIDVILSEDADLTLLGACKVQFGYKKRSKNNRKQFFDGKFPLVKFNKTAIARRDDGEETVDINVWMTTPRAKAVTTAFIGTGYNIQLWGVTVQSGLV